MATAQSAARSAHLQAAYTDWLDENALTGAAAFYHKGVLAGSVGPKQPRDLASAGKSITALCAAALVDAGRLRFEENVRDVLGDGPDVSVAALVRHTSGLVSDITQPLMPDWLDTTGHRAADILDFVQAPTGQAGAFFYNNVNYALLGLVIEAKSEDSYENTCRDLILVPAGVDGVASPRAGAYLSWGGWQMTPQDFAKLHSHWFGPNTQTGRDPFSYPHVQLGDGFYYGLGTFFRANHTGVGYNFWHFGALCFPGRFEVGSYVVTFGGTWTVMAGYDACLSDDAMLSLDRAIGQATYEALE